MDFTDHVGKEAFIRALDNGPLQLEVMKGEPTNLESALNFATKYEAYKCSLASQGTMSKSSAYTSISDDDDRPKRRSRAVNAVQDTSKDTAPQLRPPRALLLLLLSPARLTRTSWVRRNRLLRGRVLDCGIQDVADLDGTQVKSRIPRSILAITAVR